MSSARTAAGHATAASAPNAAGWCAAARSPSKASVTSHGPSASAGPAASAARLQGEGYQAVGAHTATVTGIADSRCQHYPGSVPPMITWTQFERQQPAL